MQTDTGTAATDPEVEYARLIEQMRRSDAEAALLAGGGVRAMGGAPRALGTNGTMTGDLATTYAAPNLAAPVAGQSAGARTSAYAPLVDAGRAYADALFAGRDDVRKNMNANPTGIQAGPDGKPVIGRDGKPIIDLQVATMPEYRAARDFAAQEASEQLGGTGRGAGGARGSSYPPANASVDSAAQKAIDAVRDVQKQVVSEKQDRAVVKASKNSTPEEIADADARVKSVEAFAETLQKQANRVTSKAEVVADRFMAGPQTGGPINLTQDMFGRTPPAPAGPPPPDPNDPVVKGLNALFASFGGGGGGAPTPAPAATPAAPAGPMVTPAAAPMGPNAAAPAPETAPMVTPANPLEDAVRRINSVQQGGGVPGAPTRPMASPQAAKIGALRVRSPKEFAALKAAYQRGDTATIQRLLAGAR